MSRRVNALTSPTLLPEPAPRSSYSADRMVSVMLCSGMMFGKRDVTAVVLSTGEHTTQEAIDRLRHQTLPLYQIVVIRDVRPFHKALNAGAARVTTPFFVQVDADMVLNSHCVASLRKGMRRNVGIAIGRLRDPLIGQVVGVKLFRRACFETARFENTISPDTDFVQDIARAGWNTIYISAEHFSLMYAETGRRNMPPSGSLRRVTSSHPTRYCA